MKKPTPKPEGTRPPPRPPRGSGTAKGSGDSGDSGKETVRIDVGRERFTRIYSIEKEPRD